MTHPELTPYEKELLADAVHVRGYTPDDDFPEPTEGPSEPAGISTTAADDGPGPESP